MARTTEHDLNGEEMDALLGLERVLAELHRLDSEMPLSRARTLVGVMIEEARSSTQLASDLDISLSVTSRNVQALSSVGLHGKPGSAHVEMHENIMNRREKLTSLTPKGRLLRAAFLNHLINYAKRRIAANG